MDRNKASQKLSELALCIALEDYYLEILWFRAMTQEKEWKIKRHTHSSFEFHFVAEGKCQVVLDDKMFVAEKGQFYITAPGVYHEQVNEGTEGYTELSLNFELIAKENQKNDQERYDEIIYILEGLEKIECMPYKDLFGGIEVFYEALKEAYEEKVGYYNYVKGLIMLILLKAARSVMASTEKWSDNVPKKRSYEDGRFKLVEHFIEDNISSPLSTLDIAAFMHLSDKQVSRIVRKKTGGSTKALINKMRLIKAKELLKNTTYSQKEIAGMLGFGSEYYFNQFFKKEEGDSPGSYRTNVGDVQKY